MLQLWCTCVLLDLGGGADLELYFLAQTWLRLCQTQSRVLSTLLLVQTKAVLHGQDSACWVDVGPCVDLYSLASWVWSVVSIKDDLGCRSDDAPLKCHRFRLNVSRCSPAGGDRIMFGTNRWLLGKWETEWSSNYNEVLLQMLLLLLIPLSGYLAQALWNIWRPSILSVTAC